MMNRGYKVVLSDKLYSIYKRASLSCTLNAKERRAYELLIGNIELNVLTNAAQVLRCKNSHKLPDVIYDDLYPVLLTLEDQKDLSLEALSKHTLFKLILTQSQGDVAPPYFNLKTPNINRNYTITRMHTENRQSLKDYLKNLLQDANDILIYDKYFSKKESNKQLFSLLPNQPITIKYIENGDGDNGRFIEQGCSRNTNWKTQRCDTRQVEFNRFARSHDRYLIINNKVEVTITSGFLYIWDKAKEITCVIREI